MKLNPAGNGRKAYVEFRARLDQAFRPFAPIDLPDFFCGHSEDVRLLRSELQTTGRQVAIYGERGVGKTSLAVLAYFFAGFDDTDNYLARCTADSTYEQIFGHFLLAAGAGYVPATTERGTSKRRSVGVHGASLGRDRTEKSTERAISSASLISPQMLLRVFAEHPGLLIIDEFDRVTDKSTRTRLAETLKIFSDAASATKIIVVGVAETLNELIGEHKSLTRCLATVRLDRMTDSELNEIIEAGSDSTGIVFSEPIRRRMIALSDGFPFYTHLLCRYAGEEAGQVLEENPNARIVVSETEYAKALRRAIKTGEAELSETYHSAVITIKRKTEKFKNIIWAIAYSEDREVQVQEIADNIGLLTEARPTRQSLSNPLGALIRPDKQEIIGRVRQGYYRFSNPLMRAYVRLIMEQHNIDLDGQLEFPWMRGID